MPLSVGRDCNEKHSFIPKKSFKKFPPDVQNSSPILEFQLLSLSPLFRHFSTIYQLSTNHHLWKRWLIVVVRHWRISISFASNYPDKKPCWSVICATDLWPSLCWHHPSSSSSFTISVSALAAFLAVCLHHQWTNLCANALATTGLLCTIAFFPSLSLSHCKGCWEKAQLVVGLLVGPSSSLRGSPSKTRTTQVSEGVHPIFWLVPNLQWPSWWLGIEDPCLISISRESHNVSVSASPSKKSLGYFKPFLRQQANSDI